MYEKDLEYNVAEKTLQIDVLKKISIISKGHMRLIKYF